VAVAVGIKVGNAVGGRLVAGATAGN